MYNKVNNQKYIKERIPNDRLKQYCDEIRIDLIKEIEDKIFFLLAEKTEQYGASIVEGDAEVLQDLRMWLSKKKVELNNIEKDMWL